MQKSTLNDETAEAAASSGPSSSSPNTTTSQTTVNKSKETPDFQISLNEFLEFLKLSCHVNDMISRSERSSSGNSALMTQSALNNPPRMENATKSTQHTTNHPEQINFNKLANYPLVNELFGLKNKSYSREAGGEGKLNSLTATGTTTDIKLRSTTQRAADNLAASTTTTTTNTLNRAYKGLHPKLSEKLDYVINEGVMDSVLSFICPVPIPSPLTVAGRAKAKQQQKQEAAAATAKLLNTVPSSSSTTTIATTTSASSSMSLMETTVQQLNMLEHSATTTSVTSLQTATSASSTSMQRERERERVEKSLTSSVTSLMSTASDVNSVVRATVKDASKMTLIGNNNNGTRRKSLLLMKDKNGTRTDRKEPEVIIHVCDEVKNTSRDFSCPQHLLVSKMGYFADVTAGQRLEEMDISVHCDIQIFDWLMKWVKHSANSMEVHSPTQVGAAGAAGPQLDGNNVVPILVSASFLQMEPLLLECLTFCHAHLSEVVRTSTNLACLNDAIVTRLAAMFTNLELEMVRDKKERVTPRLWTKLIQSLCEPEPEALRGHFYSSSGLFRCARCNVVVTNTLKTYVGCVPANIRLNRWGQLISHHVRDSCWDINAYILQLFKELKSWRKVYWKLWGHCHYLYCCTCEAHFPVYQMNWCRFHPEGPNFLGPVTEGRIAGPAGRYACCGQQAFRFETLPGPNGCQFREHSVLVETDRERAILAIAQLVSENYALCEHPPVRLQELAAAGEITPCWQGMSLTPQRCRQGLLPQLYPETTNLKIGRRQRGSNAAAYYFESSSDTETTSSEDDVRSSRAAMRLNACARGASDDEFSSSSDGCESEHRMTKTMKKKKRGRGKRQSEVPGRFWSGELSARSNQDHQRDFEEKVMKQVIAYVNKKTGTDQNLNQPQPLGGTYVRLEAEWREMLKQRNSNGNSTGNGGTAGNATNNATAATTSTLSYMSSTKQHKHK